MGRSYDFSTNKFLPQQEPRRGWNRALKITVAHIVRLRAMRNTKNQSGYGPLNLENVSFLNSDNFDTTDFEVLIRRWS